MIGHANQTDFAPQNWILLLCVCVCSGVHVSVLQWLQRPEKGAGATRTGVVTFVGHHVGAESEPASSEWAANAFNHGAISGILLCVSVGQRLMLDVFGASHWGGTHQLGYTGWPVCSRDPLDSAPTPSTQTITRLHYQAFLLCDCWESELSSSGLYSKRFTY